MSGIAVVTTALLVGEQLRPGAHALGQTHPLPGVLTTIYGLPRLGDPEIVVTDTWAESDGGNGHTYSAVRLVGGLTWEQAKAIAEDLGGYLATLTTAEESSWVFQNIASDPCLWLAEMGPYIGGFQNLDSDEYRETAGGWEWVTGEPWSYENWGSGQPDDAGCGPGCPGENYLHLWNQNAAQCPACDATPPCGPSNAWNDVWDIDNWGDTFLVEFEPDHVMFNPENGHYYELVTDGLLWPEALAAAEASVFQRMSGYLATITSESENNFIVEQVIAIRATSAWIGGFQPEGSQEPAGGWRWVTEEPFEYTHWGAGQPDQNGGEDEYAIELKGVDSAFPYDWHDQAGDTDFIPYIVEYSPEPLCPADLNGDGHVDAADLAILLGFWGISDPPLGDLDGNGTVDAVDLATLLGVWGAC